MSHSTSGVKVALHVEILSSYHPFFSQDLRREFIRKYCNSFDLLIYAVILMWNLIYSQKCLPGTEGIEFYQHTHTHLNASGCLCVWTHISCLIMISVVAVSLGWEAELEESRSATFQILFTVFYNPSDLALLQRWSFWDVTSCAVLYRSQRFAETLYQTTRLHIPKELIIAVLSNSSTNI